MTVEDVIYDLLMDTNALTAIVGRRIFRGFRSQGQHLPCVTFLRVSTTPTNGAAGRSGTEHVTMQIDCWAQRHDVSRAIAEAIKTALDTWTSDSSPKMPQALCTNEQDILEPPDDGSQLAEYRVIQDWSIWQVT
jgi:hypothetical protein